MGMNDALIPLSNGGMAMGGPARASFLNIMHYFNREHHFYYYNKTTQPSPVNRLGLTLP